MGNTLYDVRDRLRHRSIQTTERIYDHMLKMSPQGIESDLPVRKRAARSYDPLKQK